ncbi:MAG: HAD-IA family hydrolase [Polyangiaceae bacterium]|jgi:phosphoglycolate phosphatase|nr:HAD-IA family hydrolase [Polyangiaceae bacterium]
MFIPRVVVFDLDGTLLNTGPDITTSCNFALQNHGFEALDEQRVVRFVGDGARMLMARASGLSTRDARLDTLVEAFVSHYQEHPIQATTWLPFATHALEELSELQLALCTNKPRSITVRILAALHAEERFAVVVAGGDVPRGKPATDSLRKVAVDLEVDPREMVMIGDGPQDVLAGKSVGARTMAVATGYTSRVFLQELRPDVLLDDLRTAPDVIRRWRESTVRARKSFCDEP